MGKWICSRHEMAFDQGSPCIYCEVPRSSVADHAPDASRLASEHAVYATAWLSPGTLQAMTPKQPARTTWSVGYLAWSDDLVLGLRLAISNTGNYVTVVDNRVGAAWKELITYSADVYGYSIFKPGNNSSRHDLIGSWRQRPAVYPYHLSLTPANRTQILDDFKALGFVI